MSQRANRTLRAMVVSGFIVSVASMPGLTGPAHMATPSSTEHAEDWATPDTLAAAVYEVVSGPADAARDWDRYRALFRENARFMTTDEKDGELVVYDFGVEQYIEWYGPGFDERGVYEREICNTTEHYGHSAQRWSTCAFNWDRPGGPDVPPDGRCLTSMQFINDDVRWWIVSMVWQSETDDTPIPARYLPSANEQR